MGMFASVGSPISFVGGMADKKPEDFETTEKYIKQLNAKIASEKNAADQSPSGKGANDGVIDEVSEIKAIQKKYNVDLSPDFYKDVMNVKN